MVKWHFTYVEPFVGGGAMLFHMLQKFPKIGKVVINYSLSRYLANEIPASLSIGLTT